MLTAEQINELIKGGEGYNVDFKRSEAFLAFCA